MNYFLRGMLVVWGCCLFIFSMVLSAALIDWINEVTNWIVATMVGIFILSLYGGVVAWLHKPTNTIKIRLGENDERRK